MQFLLLFNFENRNDTTLKQKEPTTYLIVIANLAQNYKYISGLTFKYSQFIFADEQLLSHTMLSN